MGWPAMHDRTNDGAASIRGGAALKTSTFGIFRLVRSGIRTATPPRGGRHIQFPKDGRMSRILTIGAAQLGPKER